MEAEGGMFLSWEDIIPSRQGCTLCTAEGSLHVMMNECAHYMDEAAKPVCLAGQIADSVSTIDLPDEPSNYTHSNNGAGPKTLQVKATPEQYNR